jgi:glycine cleavage system aminomethyltransferase T
MPPKRPPTLRLEMGYPLNGNDLSPERTPLQAGLGFFVALDKEAFTGREALLAQKAAGLPDKLTAFRMTGAAPPVPAIGQTGEEKVTRLRQNATGADVPHPAVAADLVAAVPRFALPEPSIQFLVTAGA